MALDGNSSPSGRRSFMKRMATLAAAMLTDRAAAAQTSAAIGNSGGPATMINDMTFEDVGKLLDLSPNATCGYVRVTFVSSA